MRFDFKIIDNFDINYSKSVLIIIDMIKGFTDLGALKSEFIKGIAPDIRLFCNKFCDIIAINDKHELNDLEFNIYPKHCLNGDNECELCDELLDIKFTHLLTKNTVNGFFSDNFMRYIKKYIDRDFNFVVVGCCTDICVLQFCLTFKNYLNSINKNLDLIVPINLVDTFDTPNHSREVFNQISFYLMNNMDIKLIDTRI